MSVLGPFIHALLAHWVQSGTGWPTLNAPGRDERHPPRNLFHLVTPTLVMP